MDQIEKNIISSFNLAKHDIHMLKSQIQHLADMQEQIISTIKKMQANQLKAVAKPTPKPVVKKVVKQVIKKVIVKQARKKTHYVASKTGAKFHNENCPFAQNIKPKSKIRFLSTTKALNEGYKPCACVNKK